MLPWGQLGKGDNGYKVPLDFFSFLVILDISFVWWYQGDNFDHVPLALSSFVYLFLLLLVMATFCLDLGDNYATK